MDIIEVFLVKLLYFINKDKPIAVSMAAITNKITATKSPLFSKRCTLENINCKFIAKTNNSNAIKYNKKLFFNFKDNPATLSKVNININFNSILFNPNKTYSQ